MTPEEIALSILAEIVQLRRQSPITSRQFPITNSQPPAEAIDPVCGMTVEIATARHVWQYNGQTYYFCALGCKRSFEKKPEEYLTRST